MYWAYGETKCWLCILLWAYMPGIQKKTRKHAVWVRDYLTKTVFDTRRHVFRHVRRNKTFCGQLIFLGFTLPYLYLLFRSGWLHRWWLHPARRPQLGSNAQPQINRYGYVNLFEAFANLKRVLKRSCLNALDDIMGAPIMSSSWAKMHGAWAIDSVSCRVVSVRWNMGLYGANRMSEPRVLFFSAAPSLVFLSLYERHVLLRMQSGRALLKWRHCVTGISRSLSFTARP